MVTLPWYRLTTGPEIQTLLTMERTPWDCEAKETISPSSCFLSGHNHLREAKAKESSFKYWMRWYWSLSKWRLMRTHTNLLALRARPGDPWDRAIGEHLPFWLGRVTGELTQGFARGAGLCVRLVRLYFGVLTLGITGEKALRDIADECLKAGQRDSGPRDKPGS